jgi:hypothetical protein
MAEKGQTDRQVCQELWMIFGIHSKRYKGFWISWSHCFREGWLCTAAAKGGRNPSPTTLSNSSCIPHPPPRKKYNLGQAIWETPAKLTATDWSFRIPSKTWMQKNLPTSLWS